MSNIFQDIDLALQKPLPKHSLSENIFQLIIWIIKVSGNVSGYNILQFVDPLPPLELPDVNILVAEKYIQIT